MLIVVRNEARFLRDSLPKMLAQRFDGEIEFLLIDGDSEDETVQIAREFAGADPRLRILRNPKRTLASGLNLGLESARGQYVVQMEGHAFYPPDYVAIAVERLRRGDVAWVSGRPVPVGVDPGSTRVALALRSWLGTGGSRKWRLEPADVALDEAELDTGVFGGAWRREVLQRFGGWDESWTVNRDSELAARVLAAGGRILSLRGMSAQYVPRGRLTHLARQYWRYGFFRARTARAHPGSLRRSHVLPPALVLCVAFSLISPAPIRRHARRAVAAYALSIAVASAQAADAAHDAAGLSAVFVTQHTSWGCGFLAGCLRFGLPIRALARLASR